MSDWKVEKNWSDRFLPEIKMILGLYLIGEPPVEEDAERNTDLMVLKLDAVRIACRVRRNSYLKNYGHQFTIRYKTKNENKPEITKIMEGWGNYFFYGFANEAGTELQKWFLGNLNAFRIYMNRRLALGKTAWNEVRDNPDGSGLAAFNVLEIPDFVIADSIDYRLLKTR
jgi:hypothetical protein